MKMSKEVEMKLALKRSRNDSLEGRTTLHEIVMKKIRNKIKKSK